MILLLPLNCSDAEEARLMPILEATQWATVDIEEGRVREINFYAERSETDAWLDAVVVVNDFEPVMEFIEQQMMVLVAHTQRSIDDIVEAYLFRELHQLAF